LISYKGLKGAFSRENSSEKNKKCLYRQISYKKLSKLVAIKKAAAPKKATAKKVAAPKKAKTARKPNAAFMKALKPSSALAEIIGAAAVARTEAVKKIWGYIKKHNLQNPKNKRNILADDKLSKIFGKKEVTMFELASILGKHLS